MRRSIPIISAFMAVVLTAPVGLATWSAMGAFEPDNGEDDSRFMWESAAPAGVKRVYFNAFSNVYGVGNPNAAVDGAQTNNEIPTLEYHQAILGVWVDCNGDGYVGMIESALWEYSSNLLLDDSVCPATSGTANSWDGSHNYNGWVTELIPIAGVTRDASDDSMDKRLYRDPEAMVWGDFGIWDGPASGGTCALTPFPRGTMQSTGGIINYFDCGRNLMESWNQVLLGRTVAGVPVPGVEEFTGPTGLVFPDDDDARGSWADMPTFGEDSSDNSAVVFADCEAAPIFHSGDFFNDTPLGPTVPANLQNESVRGLQPAPGNTGDPTLPGTYNATNEEVLGDCDYDNDAGADFYGGLLNEGDFNGVSTARKTEADWNLQFTDSDRGTTFAGPGFTGGVVPGGTAGANQWVGLDRAAMAVGVAFFNATSMWESDSILVKTLGPNTVRADLENPGIDDPYFLSFYAHVGKATTDLNFEIPSGRGVYGAPQCGENDSGIHNGWECDTSFWYQSPDGSFIPEPYPFARPGQAYEFRDVDCYDGAVGTTGVGLGLPFYGTDPCP